MSKLAILLTVTAATACSAVRTDLSGHLRGKLKAILDVSSSTEQSCGSCINNPRTWDATSMSSVCLKYDAEMAACGQKPFPEHYFSHFADVSGGLSAEEICDSAMKKGPAKFEGSGMGTSFAVGNNTQMCVSLEEAARIYMGNNPASSAEDCRDAITIIPGEATHAGKNAQGEAIFFVERHEWMAPPAVGPRIWSDPGNIWQDANTNNSKSVDESATEANRQHTVGTNVSKGICYGAPDKVPPGFPSAGNSNWIGPFCHVNRYYVDPQTQGRKACDMGMASGCGNNMAWGGGQCSGGKPSTKYPTSKAAIEANQCSVPLKPADITFTPQSEHSDHCWPAVWPNAKQRLACDDVGGIVGGCTLPTNAPQWNAWSCFVWDVQGLQP